MVSLWHNYSIAAKKEALAVGTFGAVRVLRYFHYIKQGQKCQ